MLDAARELGGEAVERATGRLAATYEALRARGVADRVQLDLGLLRDLGYYTGAILEVYDPAARPRARRRRPLRRADGPLRAPAARGRLRALPGAAAHRAGGGGAAAAEAAGDGSGLARPTRRADGDGPLKLAVPRGALFAGTLDLLDRVGVDTAEARGDSRALIFEPGELTLVTMRPSDVPTYVEAGAADLGITGKDVLLEQRDRAVYELLDLGFGACRMVLAGRRGDERLGEAERRLGAMRIATKYPRIAERYFERTGRQAEVIEVKGSVELAPLVGPRRRDRRPRRHRPDPGRERPRGARGDRRLHRAPGRQPGRPQAARAEIDALVERLREAARDEGRADRLGRRRRRGARRAAARDTPGLDGRVRRPSPRSSRGCASGGDEAVRELAAELRRGRCPRRSASTPRRSPRRRAAGARRARGAAGRRREHRGGRRAPSSSRARAPGRGRARPGPAGRDPRRAGRRGRRLRARGAAPPIPRRC